MCFAVLRCIWQCFINRRNSVQNGLKWCKECTSLCHEVASEFFTIDTPDPPHWNLNSCIGAFCSIWVHFGLFRYCMKLGAKQAELEQLMQKFVPRSRIGIFSSERTRSIHWTVNSCFGAFGSVWMHFGLFR